MKSVILGAIILLFACVFIAKASMADEGVLASSPLANCWASDSDGFDYPVPGEVKCFDTPAKAKAAALASCKKHSPAKSSCYIMTCGWCGRD